MKVIVEKTNGNSIDIMYKKIKGMTKAAELIIITGDRESSNVKNLYDIGLKENGNIMIVQNIEDLYLNYVKRFKVIGLIDTNFLPQQQVEEIVNVLENTQVEGYIYGRFK